VRRPPLHFREERLILALALDNRDELERHMARADWDRAARIAGREAIGGYLYGRLRSSGLAPLAPASFRQSLAAAHRKTTLDNMLLLVRLREAAAALTGSGTPFIVLKGGALLADVYTDPGTRALTDIDLLIPEERAPVVREAFSRLGWREVPQPGIAPRRFQFKTAPPGSCGFEVHWDLSQRHRFQADVPSLWANARPFSLEGVEALRLGDTDEFVYLALHFAAHYFGISSKWLFDLVEVARMRPPDWNRVAATARAWKGRAALSAALLFLGRTAPGLAPPRPSSGTGMHPLLDLFLFLYRTENPLRLVRELPRGPSRLIFASLLQDRIRDRVALAWLVRTGKAGEDD
jgi:hypothetical protein